MGMDVFGLDPKSKKGEYFRRNIWSWHPLWDMCQDLVPDVCGDQDGCHYNDGEGLDEISAIDLRDALVRLIEDGTVKAYIAERNTAISALPLEDCEFCETTGIRNDEVGKKFHMDTFELPEEQAILLGRTHGTCNACNGEGKKTPFAANYGLDEQDVAEWVAFLSDCGGFAVH